MERSHRSGAGRLPDGRADPPSPRSAAGAAHPVARDEASAAVARMRLREQGIVPIEPDDAVGVMLDHDERVITVRRSVCLERRAGSRDPGAGIGGDLYVTTRRLLHLGRVPVEYELEDIRDAVVTEDALLLLVGSDRGLTIRVGDPRLLRVEIAAAREAKRAAEPGRDDERPGVGSLRADGQRPSR